MLCNRCTVNAMNLAIYRLIQLIATLPGEDMWCNNSLLHSICVCMHACCRPVSRVLCNHCEGWREAQSQCSHTLLHGRGGLRQEHEELHPVSQDCCRMLQRESCLCGHQGDSTLPAILPGECHALFISWGIISGA